MSDIDLMLDEENELTFQLNIEGSRPAEAKCRLRIDHEHMGIVLEADSHRDGEVIITIPPLNHVLSEGAHDIELEVIVDDKFFTPLQMTANFEKSVKVEAKAVVKRKKKKTSVSSNLLETTKKRKESVPLKPTVSVRNSKTNTQQNINETKISDDDIMKIIKALQGKR